MPRPSTLPQWATSGSVVTPSAGKIAAGWLISERPAAQFFNWWQNLVGSWITALANELDALNPILGNLGFLDTLNRWQRAQRFDFAPSVDVAEPLVYTLATPADYTNAANKWRALVMSRIQQTPRQTLVLWAGRPDAGSGNRTFAITVNALWDGPAQRWEQEDASADSHALLIDDGKLRFSTRGAGTANWTTWTTAAGTVRAAVYDYAAAKSRTVPVPLGSFHGAGYIDATPAVGLDGTSNEGPPSWPVVVPPGCSITALHIFHQTDQNDVGDKFTLWQRTAAGWNKTFASVVSNVSAGPKQTNLVLGTPALVTDDNEYLLVWSVTSGDPAATNNVIYGITCSRSEPGPRNG